MADAQLQKQFREPEDIFARAESSKTSDIRRPSPGVTYERSSSLRAPRESKKVVILMVGFLVLVTIGGVGWFFFPAIVGMFERSPVNVPSQDDQASRDLAGTSDRTNTGGAVEKDSDHDGLPDTQEEGLGLLIDDADTDNDNLSDRDEVSIYATDPRKADTDGDSFADGDEVRQGFDPNGPGRLDDIFRIIPKT